MKCRVTKGVKKRTLKRFNHMIKPEKIIQTKI
jgi:hypothetical protein